MSKLPITDAKTFEKILLTLGFNFVRQKGSHKFYRHQDGRYTTLPHHGKTDISRPLMREILKQIEISPEEFLKLLSNF
jgi:predicted RNA binding protein YcfA (HicA-like mRNA interferase family)